RTHKAIIEALLIHPTETVKKTSERLNIARHVVQAFQDLFFDIEGRRDDRLFIASLVYPQSRLVEMHENYTRSESLEVMLLRAGYDKGPDYVTYLAGVDNLLVAQNASKEAVAKLEANIMANAYILSQTGFLNSNGPGLAHARQLMAAAKQG